MAQLTMSRRNFMKTMAITGAAAAVSSSAVAPHASSRRRCQRNRWRAEARAHVLPCLRQGGVRRLGDGAGRQGHQGRRRRVGAPEPRSLLREVAVFHARGLSSRSSALPREAHEPQGLGRSRLGAHHAGRGLRAVGPGLRRGRRQVRRTVHLRHVRHVARVVARPLPGHGSSCSARRTRTWPTRSARARVTGPAS